MYCLFYPSVLVRIMDLGRYPLLIYYFLIGAVLSILPKKIISKVYWSWLQISQFSEISISAE